MRFIGATGTNKEEPLEKQEGINERKLVNGKEEEDQIEAMEEDEAEEMEPRELDLDEIKKEYEKGRVYVLRRQMELLQEVSIKTKAHQQLGIVMDPPKGNKRKSPREYLKKGRKMNKQRIVEVGVKLIELG